MFLFAPINAEIDVHVCLLARGGKVSIENVGDGVPVKALTAQHVLDSATEQAWGTVRYGRSQRRLPAVLESQAIDR